VADSAVFGYSDSVSRVWARGTHALIAVVLLALAVIGLTGLCLYLYQEHEHQKPLFFLLGEFGETYGKSYEILQFNKADPRFERARVMQSFLAKFVRLEFQFKRKSAVDDLPEALYFMNTEKAKPLEAAYRSGYIAKLLRDPGQQEITIDVENVDIESVALCGGARQRPCTAQVQYERAVGNETSRCIADLHFEFAEGDRSFEEIEENPLGLAVDDFSSQCGAARPARTAGM